MTPEVIRALTPALLAAIGGAIAITVLIVPKMSDAKWAAGMGLASTAIAGAAGLAQTTKSESSVSVDRGKIEAEGGQDG